MGVKAKSGRSVRRRRKRRGRSIRAKSSGSKKWQGNLEVQRKVCLEGGTLSVEKEVQGGDVGGVQHAFYFEEDVGCFVCKCDSGTYYFCGEVCLRQFWWQFCVERVVLRLVV